METGSVSMSKLLSVLLLPITDAACRYNARLHPLRAIIRIRVFLSFDLTIFLLSQRQNYCSHSVRAISHCLPKPVTHCHLPVFET